jgi:hypothetical protein
MRTRAALLSILVTLVAAPTASAGLLTYPPVNTIVGGLLPPVAPALDVPLGSFSVVPPLPDGLTLDPVTGVVSGVASEVLAVTEYTVSAVDALGLPVTGALNLGVAANGLPVVGPGLGLAGLGAEPPPLPGDLPPPEEGVSATAIPLASGVLIRRPGTKAFVPFLTGASIPMGSDLDTRAGAVQLTIENARGQNDSSRYYGGVFRLTQAAGVATLSLIGGSFRACPRRGAARGAAVPKLIRHLWGKGSGAFRTRGRLAAATIRGTTWRTADRCDGTLVTVREGRVAVRDLVRRRTRVLRAGQRYLARPR